MVMQSFYFLAVMLNSIWSFTSDLLWHLEDRLQHYISYNFGLIMFTISHKLHKKAYLK